VIDHVRNAPSAGFVAAAAIPTAVDKCGLTDLRVARWLLAYVLDFHRREEKALWWEYFRLSDLSAEDLSEERAGLSGLKFVNVVGGTAKAPIHRYIFHHRRQKYEWRGIEESGWTKIWQG
jgi:hypothetical protein